VSHDEEILHAFAKRLIIFDGGNVRFFDGTYQDFLERVGWIDEASVAPSRSPPRPADRRIRAEQILQKSRAIRPLEQKIKQIEDEIRGKENFVAECEKNMITAAEQGNGLKIAEISREMEAARNRIAGLYAEWERVNVELEAFTR
jgi:ATP-binding cassette subfamily F protein 3